MSQRFLIPIKGALVFASIPLQPSLNEINPPSPPPIKTLKKFSLTHFLWPSMLLVISRYHKLADLIVMSVIPLKVMILIQMIHSESYDSAMGGGINIWGEILEKTRHLLFSRNKISFSTFQNTSIPFKNFPYGGNWCMMLKFKLLTSEALPNAEESSLSMHLLFP